MSFLQDSPKCIPGLLLLLLLTVFHLSAFAGFSAKDLIVADSTMIQSVTLKDGSVLIGRIIQVDSNTIEFQTTMGVLTVPIVDIENIETQTLDTTVSGKYWFVNPNTTRLYFAPTARMLKRGKGYFSDYYIFFPGFAYGLTGNITIGAGCSVFPGLNLSNQIYFLTPKIGIRASRDFSLAVGALIIGLPAEMDEDISTMGILYGVGTLGSPRASLTMGLGYGFAGDELTDSPMAIIGGESRISRRMALVTENWFIPGLDYPLVSYGMRFFGPKISVDLAFWTIMGEGWFFPGIPYIDFVVNF